MPRIADARSIAIWGAIAVSCLVAWLLYPHPAREAREEGVTEIVLWSIQNTFFYDAMKPVLEEFERHNPQYRVRLGTATVRQDIGDPTRFLLGVAGGMPPDLIFFDRFAIVEWASRGAFTDLTPYIERDRDKPDGIRKENFYPIAWDEPIYKGKNYALANGLDARGLFYSNDALERAELVYGPGDPEVKQGSARAGEARPPKTWEEMCRKRLHGVGQVESSGKVKLVDFVRRPGVNVNLPADARPDLNGAGVRPGDVVALVAGENVFRGRVASVDGADGFQIDLARDQREGLTAIPSGFTGRVELKLFDQDSYSVRLTRFDQHTGKMTSMAIEPAVASNPPVSGNADLYFYSWQNGGEFISPDGAQCTLDSEANVEALQWVTDLYDSMGGYKTTTLFFMTPDSTGIDTFLRGAVAMRMESSYYLRTILIYKPAMNFGFSPAPVSSRLLATGEKPFGWAGGFAYAIPSTARQKEGAWALLKWFSSLEGSKLWIEAQATISRANSYGGESFLPDFSPDYRVNEWIRQTYIANNPQLSPHVVKAFDALVALLPTCRHRPVTPVGQMLWNEQKRASDAAVSHGKLPYDALNYGQRQVQAALDGVLHPPTGPVVNWKLLIGFYAAFVVALFGGLIGYQELKRRRVGGRRGGWIEGYIAASPWLVGLIVFGAGPILFSMIISFCNYDVLSPARFIGLHNYVKLLGRHHDAILDKIVWNDPIFWKSLGNTLYMVIAVPLSIVLGLAMALLLDAKVRGLHLYRTIFYLPAIVPAVASFILWLWLLDPSVGLVNQGLTMLGISNPPKWLQDPQWSKPSLILLGLWGVGSGMIIWLAGLKDIPETYYEAASIDGANRFQQLIRITIPLLSPYIFFNLIMGLIGTFQVFESALIMTDGGPADSTLFYAYKLFNEAFKFLNMGVASAMAWLLFIIVLAITLLQLWLGKKWVHYGG